MSLTQINKAGLDEIALDHVFTIGASGSSAYTFQGEGLNGTVYNPTLYLTRGKTYRFENGSGGHPIRIQSTSGASGTAYNTGVTNNAGSGTVIVEVQHDAPDVLYYQCTSHAAMNGILYITGALADGGVTTAKLAANAVTTAKIADDAITSAKISSGGVQSSNMSSNSVTTGAISTGAVTTAKIADDAVTNAKIAAGAVSTTELSNSGVSTNKIADDAVTSAKIAAGAVSTTELSNSGVSTAKIADQAVTLAKLEHGTSSNDGKFLRANNGADPTFETISTTPADGSITEAKLASGAVTQTKIGDGSIINAKVDNSAAIAGTKISPDFGSQNVETDGEVRTGTYIRTRVASGGHFYLRNNSTGANYSSHLQTCSGGENNNVQTHVHYYHGGYAELLHQGNSSVRTLSNGTQFRNGGNVNGQITPSGLAFGGDTSAANSLHDYEYGSWTPTYAATGGVYGTLNYSVQTGQYVKIGRLVMVQFYINYNFGSVGGNFRIGGLPYAANSYGAGSVMMGNHTLDQAKFYQLHTSNDSYLYLYGTEHGTSWHSAGADNAATIIGTSSYYTTS